MRKKLSRGLQLSKYVSCILTHTVTLSTISFQFRTTTHEERMRPRTIFSCHLLLGAPRMCSRHIAALWKGLEATCGPPTFSVARGSIQENLQIWNILEIITVNVRPEANLSHNLLPFTLKGPLLHTVHSKWSRAKSIDNPWPRGSTNINVLVYVSSTAGKKWWLLLDYSVSVKLDHNDR